jgi:hypothetical protein
MKGKLHWFQFRTNHNILATNYFLKKIKIIDDANCNFCQNDVIEKFEDTKMCNQKL